MTLALLSSQVWFMFLKDKFLQISLCILIPLDERKQVDFMNNIQRLDLIGLLKEGKVYHRGSLSPGGPPHRGRARPPGGLLASLSTVFIFWITDASDLCCAQCLPLSLLRKAFVGTGKNTFLERVARPLLVFAAKNTQFQGRVTKPPLKTHLQGRATPPPAPANEFPTREINQ